MRLDHIVVGCADLQSGTDWLEARLQVPAGGGGEHVGYGTHNRLWRLDANRYLPGSPRLGASRRFSVAACRSIGWGTV